MANTITYPADSKSLSKELVYRHCVARGESVKNLDDGTEITIKSLVAYDTDEGNKIISILDTDNRHYVSNSSIFRSELEKIVEIFGDHDITIRIRKNVSKQGRTFVTCELA